MRHRPLAEDLARLDVRQLRPVIIRALAQCGAISDHACWFSEHNNQAVLKYHLSPREGKVSLAVGPDKNAGFAGESISLTATAQPFGGRRWWLCCPGCERRAGVLYAQGGSWRCRPCARVIYRSSCQSDKRVGPILRAFERYWLGDGVNPLLDAAQHDFALPDGPPLRATKGMLRLQRELQLLAKANAVGLARLEAGRRLYRSRPDKASEKSGCAATPIRKGGLQQDDSDERAG